MLASCTEAGSAAVLCRDFTSDGYGDWYLPSLYEGQKIVLSQVACGLSFPQEYFWSSSQLNGTWEATYAMAYNTGPPPTSGYAGKTKIKWTDGTRRQSPVRCITQKSQAC